jgi:hypothetical protein
MSEQKSGSTKKPLVIAVTVLAVAVVGISVAFAYYIKNNNNANNVAEEDETPKREYVVNEDNADEIRDALSEPVEDAYYNVTMNTDWTCSSSSLEVADAYIENSEENDRTVYFNVIVPDTGEVVYSSPFIPVGEKMSGFTLDSSLPSGKNTVWVEYHLVNDNEKDVATVTVSAVITVT